MSGSMAEPVDAVLFDFSGTLMRGEAPYRRVSAVLAEAGVALPDAEIRDWADRLERSGGLPGGHYPAAIPEPFLTDWLRRDLVPAAHRAAYTGLMKNTGFPWPELADAIYERSTHPDGWTVYPDSLPSLSALAGRGIRTAVVSNIGWNPRHVLDVFGIAPLVDAVLLSYEEGCCKPDPALFTKACARLGVEPERTLMVGDDRTADGGAEAIGIRTFFVDPLPVTERPDGFAPVLAEAGVAR
jgi:HAD superfamily hydrolase (TIGR01509 family)